MYDLNDLTRDVSDYLREQPHFDSPLSFEKKTPKPAKAIATAPAQKPIAVKTAPSPKPAAKKSPPPLPEAKKLAEPAPSNLSLLEKHLPHVKLKNTPPPAPSSGVAILVENKEGLPFLKNLASAIQSRFCKVKLIDVNVLDQKQSWQTTFEGNPYSLILSQRKQLPEFLPKERVILLASIETYQNNTESKKALWSSLCQKLTTHKSP